jgi:hypothetical protein
MLGERHAATTVMECELTPCRRHPSRHTPWLLGSCFDQQGDGIPDR